MCVDMDELLTCTGDLARGDCDDSEIQPGHTGQECRQGRLIGQAGEQEGPSGVGLGRDH